MDGEEETTEDGRTDVPTYWPPEQAMRLECLRLAVGRAGEPLETAKQFYDFVMGKAAAE